MKKILLLTIAMFTLAALSAQTAEHYLSITTNTTSDIDELTQIVSIDKVKGNQIIAYANDNELEKLKKTKYSFEILEHPSVKTSKAIIMATTVEQMVNWDRYPTNGVYNEMMKNFTNTYPALCTLDTIGTSVQNKNIVVLNITNSSAYAPKPEVLLSSTMHGDELTGWILCMRLADFLLSNYGGDNRITQMLDSVSIFIAPNTNPDGTFYGGDNTVSNARRSNYNGIDINRNFPDPRTGANSNYAKETQIMMDYADTRNFALAINYHGGAELANYPWDTWRSAVNLHADNNWYSAISRKYATYAQNNSPAGYFTEMNNGITNGGDWYVINGGRQDYMNYWHNCREITLEVSTTKMLSTDLLPDYWEYNKEAMLSYIENVYYGIRGTVTSADGQPLAATITVINHDKDNSHIITNPAQGNYYRMISPGTYSLKFESYGYISQNIPNIAVLQDNSTVYLDVVMQKAEVYSVTGTVINSQTGQPEENVKITVQNTTINSVYTGAEGIFYIPDVMEGEYTVLFEKQNYLKKALTVNVSVDMEPLSVLIDPFEGFSFEDEIIPEGFSFSGDNTWFITDAEAYDGTHSLRSGQISNSQTSTMAYTFNCEEAGFVSYYAKISTETGGLYDYLEFSIDGASKGTWYGEIAWQEYSFEITQGTHTLQWTYSRDFSAGGGSDAVWIDFVAVPLNNTPIPLVTPQSITLETEKKTGETQITIQNIGKGVLDYSAFIENEQETTWLTLSNNSGAIFAEQSVDIVLNYDFSEFETGMFASNILINVPDSTITIPIIIEYLLNIEQQTSRSFRIYPNPAKNEFAVELTKTANTAKIEIYTISGIKLYSSQQFNAGTNVFYISDLGIKNEGIYLIKVETDDFSIMQKIVVE